jgi:hypothetical protein
MTKFNRIDRLIKLGFLAFWVFVIGMLATNEQFRTTVLHPLIVS